MKNSNPITYKQPCIECTEVQEFTLHPCDKRGLEEFSEGGFIHCHVYHHVYVFEGRVVSSTMRDMTCEQVKEMIHERIS